jgi:hypothetical protein
VWKQADALKDVSDTPTQFVGLNGTGILPVDEYSTGARLDQPVHHLESRRLAGPGSAQQDDELALGDLERQTIHGRHLAVAARQLLRFDHLEMVLHNIGDFMIFDSLIR